MLKKIVIIMLSIFSIFFTQCGLFEPDTHEVTVDNRSSTNILVTFSEGGVPVDYLTVNANSIGEKKMEGDGSYTIIVAYGGGTWSTSNSRSDITIIVPATGKPYEK